MKISFSNAFLAFGFLVTAAVPMAAQQTITDAEPVVLDEMVVSASRFIQPLNQVPQTVDQFSAEQLQSSPALTVDGALGASPAFSLFRRTSSLMAHPTAQGVSLRGVGPSGASRTMVLMDGVPLNDPFGGWVAWSKIPHLTLTNAEIVRGGGSGSWGSSALGGVVQLFSNNGPATGNHLTGEVGTNSTLGGEWHSRFRAAGGLFASAGARWFSTDGFYQYRPEDRGPIDRPFDAEHKLVHAKIDYEFSNGVQFGVGGRWFDEERGNGTPYRDNTSREQELRTSVSGAIGANGRFEGLAYVQNQTYSARFSSLDETRTTETPALDQFDVPATSYGAALVTHWDHDDSAGTTVGADFRHTNGETREAFFYSNGEFLRNRFAGGTQFIGGVFANHHRKLGRDWTGQLSARLDHWRMSDGHRRETNTQTGANTVDETYPDRDGTEFSPSIGAVWSPTENTNVRLSAYHAFRLPTLNEFYRPFRVGSVTTLANPDLATETLRGVDGSISTKLGGFDLSFGAFVNELDDAVANITLSSDPSGNTRQRLNLDEVRVRGVEARVGSHFSEFFSASVSYLYSDARVMEASVAPDLVGNRLPQVPRHTATFDALWLPTSKLRLNATARAFSSQFEDDANTLELDAAVTFDFRASYALTDNLNCWITVENIFDAQVETSKEPDGLTTIGPGRFVRAGVGAHW